MKKRPRFRGRKRSVWSCRLPVLPEKKPAGQSQYQNCDEETEDVSVSGCEGTELEDYQRYQIGKAALIADRGPEPLPAVHLTLDCADGRKAGSTEKVEYQE